MAKTKRTPVHKKIWCKIRYWQSMKDISDAELAAILKVGDRTLKEYNRTARNVTLEKLDDFLYANNLELSDLM